MKKLTVFALVALLLVSVFAFAGCKPEESGDVLKVGTRNGICRVLLQRQGKDLLP